MKRAALFLLLTSAACGSHDQQPTTASQLDVLTRNCPQTFTVKVGTVKPKSAEEVDQLFWQYGHGPATTEAFKAQTELGPFEKNLVLERKYNSECFYTESGKKSSNTIKISDARITGTHKHPRLQMYLAKTSATTSGANYKVSANLASYSQSEVSVNYSTMAIYMS